MLYRTATNSTEEKEQAPNPWWASCRMKSIHNVLDKNLSIDNVFENQTIELDDYKGKVCTMKS